jgi:membrane associated rhomboid family serine protease
MAYRDPGFANPFGFTITLWVKRLLIANGVVFLLSLAWPPLVMLLGFNSALDVAIWRPWTLVTYMFVHAGFFHLLFNMLVLFFFGPPLEERWGPDEFLKFYLICGVGGALLSLVFPGALIVGASGAIFGVMLAFAMYWPDNPIYIWGIFPVKAKYLVGALIGLNLLYAISGPATNIAYLAHLGGALAAFIYLKSSWGPTQWGGRGKPAKAPKPKAKPLREKFAELHRTGTATQTSVQARPDEEKMLDDIDRILDKISERGIQSLTPEERTRLDEASRRFRTN